MEWTSCTLMMTTYLTSQNDPKKAELEMYKRKEALLVEAIIV
jgi:hypothetical protein